MGPTGFEPATPGLKGRCCWRMFFPYTTRLSYEPDASAGNFVTIFAFFSVNAFCESKRAVSNPGHGLAAYCRQGHMLNHFALCPNFNIVNIVHLLFLGVRQDLLFKEGIGTTLPRQRIH